MRFCNRNRLIRELCGGGGGGGREGGGDKKLCDYNHFKTSKTWVSFRISMSMPSSRFYQSAFSARYG